MENQMITATELCKSLKISRGKLQQMLTEDKGFPVIRVGKKRGAPLRFDFNEVMNWLKENTN